MNVALVIQARMDSRRCPGKVLREAHGKPVLAYLLERLSFCSLADKIIVATSTEPSDDLISKFCDDIDINCYRGSLENVTDRFVSLCNHANLDYCVRISADSPLLDPKIIDRAVELCLEKKVDLVTNVHPRSFPKGQSVEVINSKALSSAYKQMQTAEDREHVTPYFYNNDHNYSIYNFSCSTNCSHLNMCIDTEDDLIKFSHIIDQMESAHTQYSLRSLLPLYINQENEQ